MAGAGCGGQAADLPFEDDDRIVIDLGEEDSAAYLVSGWSTREEVGGRSVQWNEGSASAIRFQAPFSGDAYVVSAASAAISGVRAQEVSVWINETLVGTAAVDEGFNWWQLVVPPGVLVQTENTAEFRYRMVVRPVHHGGPGARDIRRLAVLWDQVRIEPIGQAAIVDAGTWSGRRALRDGWSTDELWDEHTVVWSDGPASAVEAVLEPLPRPYELVIEARGDRVDVPVSMAGHSLGRVPLNARLHSIVVPLPADLLSTGGHAIQLRYPLLRQPAAAEDGSQDHRLLAAMLDWMAVLPRDSWIEVDFGTPDARVGLQAGWASDEVVDDRSAVWSDDASSVVVLPCQPIDAPYELGLDARAIVRGGRHVVHVFLNGQNIGQLQFENESWRHMLIPIPKSALSAGINLLEFRYSYTVRPQQEVPGSSDARSLALLVDRLVLRPRPARRFCICLLKLPLCSSPAVPATWDPTWFVR